MEGALSYERVCETGGRVREKRRARQRRRLMRGPIASKSRVEDSQSILLLKVALADSGSAF